jgi:hypothetical protein
VSGSRANPGRELAEGTALGGVYVRRLRRRQLGLSLVALVPFAGLVAGLVLVLYLVPSLQRVHVLGIPLSAALLLVPPFVAFVALAVLYERRAEALEEAFREIVRDE